MILYHGTTIHIEKIDLQKSKPNKDFGKGFYLSADKTQAMAMAAYKAEQTGGEPILNAFEFDEALLTNNSLKVKIFEAYDKEWADFILAILKKNKITDGLVLELGCGTGKLMSLLGNAGFDMIGVDNSVDMLQIAREKTSPEFLYLLQDMREFELYGTVKAVVSVCDSVNYITEKEDLTEVFRLVNNYLDPKGLFIFDFNTDYKYRDMIGETVIAEDREDVSFIWFNEYDEESQLNDIDLKVFVQEDGDCYRKFQEEHIQRGYSLQEIKQMLEESGLVFLQAFDEYSNQEPRTDSGRIVVVAQENGKEKQEETE